MEPETKPEIISEQKLSSFETLRTVTPVSKYLAMALFIILPFLGAWIGYNYAPEKLVEVEKVVEKEVPVERLTEDPLQITVQESEDTESIQETVNAIQSTENASTTSQLDKCFVDIEFEPTLDTSDWENYRGYGFAIKYPNNKVGIEHGEWESQAGIAEYTITSKMYEGQAATIKAYRLNKQTYKARYMHSGPIAYELYSDSWWRGSLGRWDSKKVKQCEPNSIGNTLEGELQIYATADGDVGFGFTNYFVVLRETPTDNYEPLIIEFSVGHSGDGFSIKYYNAEKELRSIVESMIETLEVKTTSKG